MTHPDSVHGADVTGFDNVMYDSCPAEEKELEQWINKTYAVGIASTRNGPYHLLTSDCFNFADDVLKKFQEIRRRDGLPVTYKDTKR